MKNKNPKFSLQWSSKIEKAVGFTQIPNNFTLGNLGVNGQEFSLLLCFLTFKGAPRADVYPSKKTLAQKMGMSVRHVERLSRSLEKKGLINKRVGYVVGSTYLKTFYDLRPLVKKLDDAAESLPFDKETKARIREAKKATPSFIIEKIEFLVGNFFEELKDAGFSNLEGVSEYLKSIAPSIAEEAYKNFQLVKSIADSMWLDQGHAIMTSWVKQRLGEDLNLQRMINPGT